MNMNFDKIYNYELIFSMQEVEGVGAFSFGVGCKSVFPCGKTEILNMMAIPSGESSVAFDEHDSNIFSNGQVDIFFDKCY